MSLPYPGRYESHGSWMRRCDEYERDQQRWRREQAARHTNWGGYHYTPVAFDVVYTLNNGQKIKAVKVGYGFRNAYRVKEFATKNFLSFIFDSNGLKGICERIDCVAFKDPLIDEIYSNDNH